MDDFREVVRFLEKSISADHSARVNCHARVSDMPCLQHEIIVLLWMFALTFRVAGPCVSSPCNAIVRGLLWALC